MKIFAVWLWHKCWLIRIDGWTDGWTYGKRL